MKLNKTFILKILFYIILLIIGFKIGSYSIVSSCERYNGFVNNQNIYLCVRIPAADKSQSRYKSI